MLSRIFRPRFHAATIDTLYGAIVAQARLPEFYEEFGVADTVEGRFELILLHLALVIRRLEREPRCAALGRGVIDAFGRDMDHNLREMGVGDLTVPKQMKRVFEAYYGRLRSYQAALAEQDAAALEAVVARNVFDVAPSTDAPARAPAETHPGAAQFARYVRRAAEQLERTDGVQILSGRLAFPAPRAILAGDENRTDRQD
jgi:cytochrome b pre-mRNA-processing protein 3